MQVNTAKIRGLMAEHGDTQAELAAKLGISENTLRHYLKGTSEMRVSQIGEIAKIYNVAPLDLLKIDG